MAINWFKYSSPQTFYPIAGKMVPWFMVPAAVLGVAGLYIAFFVAPTDFQQGESYRIIFIHVPAAWMSMFIYVVMASWAGIGLAFNTRLSSMMAHALAPTGALMTFIALWTGSLWGKPTWGALWCGMPADFRTDPSVSLYRLYVAGRGVDDPRRADKASACCRWWALSNSDIYFSVQWWNTLHQGHRSASVVPQHGSHHADRHACDGVRVLGLFDRGALMRVRNIVLERERKSAGCLRPEPRRNRRTRERQRPKTNLSQNQNWSNGDTVSYRLLFAFLRVRSPPW